MLINIQHTLQSSGGGHKDLKQFFPNILKMAIAIKQFFRDIVDVSFVVILVNKILTNHDN